MDVSYVARRNGLSPSQLLLEEAQATVARPLFRLTTGSSAPVKSGRSRSAYETWSGCGAKSAAKALDKSEPQARRRMNATCESANRDFFKGNSPCPR